MTQSVGNVRDRRRRHGGDGDRRVPTWEEVAREQGRFIYTVAYRLTGNHQEAQDLVQDVLVRVRRGLEGYQPGNLEGWLARITTNAFLDEVRRRKRRPTEAFPDEPDRVLPSSASADEVLESVTLSDELQQAIAGLDPDFRTVLVLSDVVGLPYAEIAEQLDIPLGTVRSRLHRARSHVREALS